MSSFRYAILAAACVLAVTAGAQARDDRKDDPPDARYCTNDPSLANNLYEYLQDCPAAQAMLNSSDSWVAVQRGTGPSPGMAPAPSSPSPGTTSPGMTSPGTTSPGTTSPGVTSPGVTGPAAPSGAAGATRAK